MNNLKRTDGKPHNRLTRICDAMLSELDVHPENDDDVQCVVMIQAGKDGGIALHGYETEKDAVIDMLFHAKAILNTVGKDLAILPMGKDQ